MRDFDYTTISSISKEEATRRSERGMVLVVGDERRRRDEKGRRYQQGNSAVHERAKPMT